MEPVGLTRARRVRAKLLHQADEMIQRLRGLLDPHGRVTGETHALRKSGKTLRGGLTLCGMEKRAIRPVSAVGKLLGAPRDAVSRQTTWRRLKLDEEPLASDPGVAAIWALLELQAKSAARRPPEAAVAWAEARIGEGREALARVPEKELAERMSLGKAKLAGRLRKRLKRLEQDDLPEVELHEARKSLKAWLGALHHLEETPPQALQELAETLGDVNDLHVLSLWLESHGFSPQLTPVVWKSVRERGRRLRRKVVEQVKPARKALD